MKNTKYKKYKLIEDASKKAQELFGNKPNLGSKGKCKKIQCL